MISSESEINKLKISASTINVSHLEDSNKYENGGGGINISASVSDGKPNFKAPNYNMFGLGEKLGGYNCNSLIGTEKRKLDIDNLPENSPGIDSGWRGNIPREIFKEREEEKNEKIRSFDL